MAASRPAAAAWPRCFRQALLDGFASAAAGAPTEWRAASGRVHVFRVCLPPAEEEAQTAAPVRLGDAVAAADDLLPVAEPPAARRAAGDAASSGASAPAVEPPGQASDRTLGTVVHRLLQALGTSGDHEPDACGGAGIAAAAAGRDRGARRS